MTQPATQPLSNNDIDPNKIQQGASNPLSSVWVGASAGTGKTKVLVDRLLRLLLPRQLEDGKIKAGTPPSKILCLTFTKAAASEMANRVNELLAKWTTMDSPELTKELKALTGQIPKEEMLDAARRLFAQVIDAPGGMKIMTLHSFCQSVLSRFPLEAGLTPGFQIADDRQANDLMNKAIQYLITAPTPTTQTALDYFITELDSNRFKDVLKEVMKKRKRITYLLDHYNGLEGLVEHLYQKFNLPLHASEKDLIKAYSPDEQGLNQAVDVLMEGTGKTDQPRATILDQWLKNSSKDRINSFSDFAQFFLTAEFEPRAKVLPNGLKEQYPQCEKTLRIEQEKIFALFQKIKILKSVQSTIKMLTLSAAIIQKYNALKKQHSLLDYDDQINLTARLLSGHKTPQWVLFKLDSGIDHILVDEAQDTSPQQWDIVQKIAEEFFHGLSTRQDDVIRTIFAVGDEKQSIYSFQNADPKLFLEMAHFFETLVKNAHLEWQRVPMNINFRSSPAILNNVDRVFDNQAMQTSIALKPQKISHIPFHQDRAGLVEIWPPYELSEKEQSDIFRLPITKVDQDNPMVSLCNDIAEKISQWLKDKRLLPSYDRPVQAGDIMILLQSRRPMMDALIKACKDRQIPVTGTDRMILTEQLVVKDILSLINFCLLPNDDLTLACLLKSPLIGMSEDDLFILAHDRKKQSLWQALKDKKDKKEKWQNIYDYLEGLLFLSKTAKPFDFISHLLVQPCPHNAKSGRQGFFSRLGMEVKDPLDELLSTAQNFEKTNPPGLQGFVHWLTETDMEIKRELSGSSDQVRIMTVHGSKGLQAPIVFIPDAFKTPSAGNKNLSFHWPQALEDPFLWAAGEEASNTAIAEIKESNKSNHYDEYCRLLYVAMTRAEDELYIAGWTGKKKNNLEQSWYAHIEKAWHPYAKEIPLPTHEKPALQITHKGNAIRDRKKENMVLKDIDPSVYRWVDRPAPPEPQRPNPLTPSRPVVAPSPVQSPLERDKTSPFWRGSLIHKILQILPDIPFENQEKILKNYLQQVSLKLPPAEQNKIAQEVMAVLTHKNYAPIFSPPSQAEVPIVGEVILGESKIAISGQIDRLLVTEKDVWVVDYKTNRPPPSDLEKVPEDYLYQMATYSALTKKLYPEHTIHCILLWTHTASWMELPSSLIDDILTKAEGA